MPIDHHEAAERVDAWALGALDAGEARELEAHLAGCASCTLLADEARDAAGAVALAVPLHAADPGVKAAVMAGARATPVSPAPRRSFRAWPAVAAASVAIGAGFVGWGTYAQAQMHDLRDENSKVRAEATTESEKFATASTQLVFSAGANRDLDAAYDALSEILEQPDMQRLSLVAARGAGTATARYAWSPAAGLGSLVVRDLEEAAADRTYALWAVYGEDWVVAGTFDVDDEGTGRLVVRDLPAANEASQQLTAFAISQERKADVIAHEGPVLLQALVTP